MGTFYDGWLRSWDDEQEERARARKFIHEEEIEWVKTKQDYRAALLCSRENGFVTAGEVMLGEIPKSWHTGKHSHGEEAIFIVDGEGFSVIDRKRYDWDKGSCVFIPFGVAHQHFNSGNNPIRYLSATSLSLERFAGYARVMQYEEAGEIALSQQGMGEPADSDVHPSYGRIVLKSQDAPVRTSEEFVRVLAEKTDEFTTSMAREMRTPGMKSHRARMIDLMSEETGFKAREVNITAVLIGDAGKNSGRHAHGEAVLYVLQGEGYSVVDGETAPWKKGTLLHVQGPQTVHQHFNTGKVEEHHLRIHFGIRSHFFQAISKDVFPYLYFEFRPD